MAATSSLQNVSQWFPFPSIQALVCSPPEWGLYPVSHVPWVEYSSPRWGNKKNMMSTFSFLSLCLCFFLSLFLHTQPFCGGSKLSYDTSSYVEAYFCKNQCLQPVASEELRPARNHVNELDLGSSEVHCCMSGR